MDIDCVSDPTLTTKSVAEVMELVNNWDSLCFSIYLGDTDVLVPVNRFRVINQRYSTMREIANECASYCVHCHPQSSWTYLANHLYRWGEFTAVEKIKPLLPLRGVCEV